MSELVSVLFGREEIRRRIEELGRIITGDYEGREPVMISVLKGGSVFLGDLIREISLPLSIDYMSISRYGGAAESMGRVRIVKDGFVENSNVVSVAPGVGLTVNVKMTRTPAATAPAAPTPVAEAPSEGWSTRKKALAGGR